MITGTNTNKAEIALNTAIFFKLIEQPQSEENTATLKGLIADGINLGTLKAGNPPLHYAIAHNRSDMIQSLIDNGAYTEVRNENKDTALHAAVRWNQIECAKILLDNKADVKAKNFFDNPPLHSAIEQNNEPMIELLLNNRLAIEARDKYNNTPLMFAIKLGNFTAAQQLLDRINVDVTTRNYDADAPLSLAVKAGNIALIPQLLRKGAEIATTYANDNTLLHYAALNNDTAMIKKLLDYRAAINAKNSEGFTPLLSALDCGKFEAAQLLIDKNANVNGKTKFCGETALHFAAQKTNSQLVQQLLNKGANINARDNYNNTPLHSATLNNDPEIFETLLDNGADFEAKNYNGDTPLKLAAKYSKLDKYLPVVIKKIIAAGRFDYVQEAFFAHFPNIDMTITEEDLLTEEALDTPEKIIAAKIATYSQEEQFKMIEIVEQQYANSKLMTTSLTQKMLFPSIVDDLTPSLTFLLAQYLQRTRLTGSALRPADVMELDLAAIEDLVDAINLDTARIMP